MNNNYIGVDLGGTFIKLGTVDAKGNILHRKKIDTKNDTAYILSKIKKYVDSQREDYLISGVGVSLPGVIQKDGTMQTAGAIKSLVGLNVKQLLSDYLDIEVEIITDSKAVALAEGWKGNGRSFSDYVCITLGSAVGGAIVIDNKLYWGLGGLAGEFGVSLIDRTNSEYKLDSASLHAGVVGGLCRKYSLAVNKVVKDANKIFELSRAGDPIAQKYVNEFFDDVARLLVNVSVTFAPQAILIGGGISENKMIMDQINKSYEKIVQEYHVLTLLKMPEISPCFFANDAGIIGAIKLVMNNTSER
ncbi:ROK family protein [Desemzia sp. RIT804]|uniref:ROK family protein n=1 Tax=Desemzia sp. RIT 804 TaxID=2810209 RepID=UPI001951F62A|nr:ROK family protein [Desemzia sp. RIT 804]MBM6614922.1 ROK family protein [Desemzia sp. RIT 804]